MGILISCPAPSPLCAPEKTKLIRSTGLAPGLALALRVTVTSELFQPEGVGAGDMEADDVSGSRHGLTISTNPPWKATRKKLTTTGLCWTIPTFIVPGRVK